MRLREYNVIYRQGGVNRQASSTELYELARLAATSLSDSLSQFLGADVGYDRIGPSANL